MWCKWLFVLYPKCNVCLVKFCSRWPRRAEIHLARNRNKSMEWHIRVGSKHILSERVFRQITENIANKKTPRHFRKNITEGRSILHHTMISDQTLTNHYPIQWRHGSIMSYGLTRLQCIDVFACCHIVVVYISLYILILCIQASYKQCSLWNYHTMWKRRSDIFPAMYI